MARTRQTARKSTGGKAPRQQFARRPGQQPQAQQAQAPQKSDLQIDSSFLVESTLYAHYFETGVENAKTFAPRYALAKIPNPFDQKETEHWLTLNFNSNLDGAGLANGGGRPDLNLVVALDLSGSMGGGFQEEDDDEDIATPRRHVSKLDVAKKSLLTIMSQLKPTDSFGLITFENKVNLVQPLAKCSDVKVAELEAKINQMRAAGGNVFTEAMIAATAMYDNLPESKNSSNRIFMLTDMGADQNDGENLVSKVQEVSNQSIWTTVIGIGLDLTSDLIHRVSKTIGCNYSNVISAKNFKEFMDKEFGYIVSPIGFNINVELKTKNYILSKGYGTPEVSNMKPGTKLFFSTEFPSAQNEKGERRAGALVFRVDPQSDKDEKFAAIVKYENIQGITESDEQELEFKDGFQDSGIRKAVLLIRYTDFVKDFMKRRSENKINPSDKDNIIEFIKYFESEKNALGDESLSEELAFLDMMLKVDYTDTWVERLPLKSIEELKKELVKLGGVIDAAKPDEKPDENQNNNNADNKEAEKTTLIEKIINIVQPKKANEVAKKKEEAEMDTDSTTSKTNKRKGPARAAKGKKKKY